MVLCQRGAPGAALVSAVAAVAGGDGLAFHRDTRGRRGFGHRCEYSGQRFLDAPLSKQNGPDNGPVTVIPHT
jgi:hypothetical protein